MILSFFVTIYSFGFEIIVFCARVLFTLSPKFASWEIDQRIAGPKKIEHAQHTAKIVWIHGASLGEVRLIPKLLSVLCQKHPHDRYVVTATTKNGLYYLSTLKHPLIDTYGYLPFDTLTRMTAFLRTFAIHRVWILETEIWPSLLYSCKKENIPIGCINGRIEHKSFLRYQQFKWLIKPLLATFNPVLVQSDEYAERYQLCGAQPDAIKVFPNLKSITSIATTSQAKRTRLRKALCISPTQLVLTAGCVHPGEGLIIRRAAEFLKNRGVSITCILVPRHLKACTIIQGEMGSDTPILTSCSAHESFTSCIINKIGILEEMYSLADVAFVGGTFVSIGGHSMWDAAQCGIPVFFGPHHQTQYESCLALQNARVGFLAGQAESIAQGILTYVVNEPGHSNFLSARDAFAKSMRNKISDLGPFLP